jgi:uncharacterized DUF497 family protein
VGERRPSRWPLRRVIHFGRARLKWHGLPFGFPNASGSNTFDDRGARVASFCGATPKVDVYAQYAYIEWVSIEFDPSKDAGNVAKHGVSLTEGDGVLDDPLCLTVEDDISEGEQRWQTIGTNIFGILYVVVWTQRGKKERIISVRRPDAKERRAYETKC